MHVAVAGGTGVVGRLVVNELRATGHHATVLARSHGTDLTSGAGLAEALRGIDAVIDTTNSPSTKKAAAIEFFQQATANLLAAEVSAGVSHHLLLSIVGIDRVGYGYYQAKLRQEQLVETGPVPWTILRATQFHEFAGQLLGRLPGPVAVLPQMRTQPIAAAEVARHLVGLIEAEPAGRVPELAGPDVLELTMMVRQLLRARGSRRPVLGLPSLGRLAGFGNGALLPSSPGPRGVQRYADWLQSRGTTATVAAT
ncbi:MAG TPA: NAD(P)H-binding protein [Jatrophihabitans sp.]|nr:NAD(P)H-binding protein [Jatrophihabitans sp.]